MRARGVLSGVAVAAGLTVALATWISRPAPPAPPAPAADPPSVTFRPGARQAYRLRIESVLRFAAAEAGGPRTIRQTLAGTLHLRVLDPGASGARAALQLEEASLSLEGRSSEELDRQLGRIFLVTFAADGAPTRFEFPSAVGEEARTTLQEAVRTFQVIVPPGAGAAWAAEEEHASGRYRAAYRLTTDGRILKTKLAYLDEGGAGGAAPPVRVSVRRAEATIRIDPAASWLERMVDEEELAASLSHGLFTASSLRAELAREPLATSAASLLEIDGVRGSYEELSAALASEEPAPRAPRGSPPAAEPRGLAELVRALDASKRTSAALLYELRDLLIRDPEAAARVLALLRAGVPDRTAAALLNALGMAATEEAQAALRTVMEDPAFGRMNRARAALALGGAPEVGDDSLAALREMAGGRRSDGLADTAVLSLGMAGDTLRRGASRRYAELREDLVRRVNEASDGSDAAAALLALGNTHDPTLAEAVAARLDDASPAARAAAAHALGKLGDGVDPDLLALRLASEEDETVRATIAASLNALPRPSAAALALVDQAIARERDPRARYEMARLLGESLELYPAGRSTLATLARQDPSRRIREYAAHRAWGRSR